MVLIDETNRGRAFMIGGLETFARAFDHFRRFPSLSAGEAALQDHTI